MVRIDEALELAVTTLGEVARNGTPDEQVNASLAILTAVKEEREHLLRSQLAESLLPVLRALGGNLAGNLDEETPYGLALQLTGIEQGNLLLQLAKVLDL